MLFESRKINIIEKVIRLEKESTIIQLESIIAGSEGLPTTKKSFADLSGIWDADNANVIEKAIEEGCEKINPDDWK